MQLNRTSIMIGIPSRAAIAVHHDPMATETARPTRATMDALVAGTDRVLRLLPPHITRSDVTQTGPWTIGAISLLSEGDSPRASPRVRVWPPR